MSIQRSIPENTYMKSVTVMLRNGNRIVLKADKWLGNNAYISLLDEGGQTVASFVGEALSGLWYTESQEQFKVTAHDEG